ncbi:hypothetical protein ZIOFF_072984 [Zingiber officinale]|uniref:CST complex subunit CTC1 n=1 Tax=Zingiber officinale TaxID=94328 RepID=A0A8J5BXX8_ZINOF|nr:hypothetical protein ZIOFF_072984 [Zingiber officinale]
MQLHEDVSLSNSSGLFAEAFMSPYNLIPYATSELDQFAEIFLTNLDKKSDCIDNFLRENYRSSQIPCLLVLSRSNSQSFQFPFYLHCARGFKDNGMLHNHSDSKILLEFSSNNLDKYQMLRVGSYYLLKCSGKGLDCKSKASKHQNGQSQHVCSCVSSVRNDKCLTENFCQPGQTFLHLNDETHGLSDVHLHMYSEAINQLEELESLLKSFHTNELPQGNLLSLSGNIESISIYDFKPKCACSSFTVCEHWSTCEVCMLVNDDCHTVRIRGSISRYAYPIGLGHAVNATFHKVLLTQNSSQTKELMLTPMSFIVVNTVKEICPLVNVEGLIQESRRNIPYEVLINTKSSSCLISNVLQCTDCDLIHLNCRVIKQQQVVCIITLVLENQTHGPVMSQPVGYPKITTASIPLLGFLVEDGSSLCYCWADYGRAETLLRLHESSQMIFSSGKIVRGPEKKYSQRTTKYLLYEMLKKHQRIIVRNHGAAPDLSCVDFSFLIDSDQVFSKAEEKFLRSIINNACHAPTTLVSSLTLPVVIIFPNINLLTPMGTSYIDTCICCHVLLNNDPVNHWVDTDRMAHAFRPGYTTLVGQKWNGLRSRLLTAIGCHIIGEERSCLVHKLQQSPGMRSEKATAMRKEIKGFRMPSAGLSESGEVSTSIAYAKVRRNLKVD